MRDILADGAARAGVTANRTRTKNVKINFMKIIITLFLIFGITYSIWDYIQWRHIEFDHFGQGQRDSDIGEQPAKLSNLYSSSYAQVRFKYPDIWELSENPKIQEKGFKFGPRLEVLRIERPFVSYILRPTLSIEVERVDTGHNDWINKEAEKHTLTEDRSIINNDKAQLVVMTWDEDATTVQEAVGSKEDRMYIFKAVTEKGAWKTYKNTFWEIYKSVVLL